MADTADIIREARITIFERGLNNRQLFDNQAGTVCLLGALGIAAGHLTAMRNNDYSPFHRDPALAVAVLYVERALPDDAQIDISPELTVAGASDETDLDGVISILVRAEQLTKRQTVHAPDCDMDEDCSCGRT